jgi:hypothetical protein
MADLPHPWDLYVRLQRDSLRCHRVSNYSWGMEAAMGRILTSLENDKPAAPDEISRAAASERRLERDRAHLRLVHFGGSEISDHPEVCLAARQELRAAESKVSTKDWSILCQLAAGHNYAELAIANGGTPGSLRIRVLRCREHLIAEAA